MRAIFLTLLTATAAVFPFQADSQTPNAYEFVNLIHSVQDLDKSVAFYRDIFGMQVRSADKSPRKDEASSKLAGLHGAKIRRAVLTAPETGFALELVEYTGVKRAPVLVRKQDACSTNFNFRVHNADEIWAQAKKLGMKPITEGGEPLDQKNANNTTSRIFFFYDPDGFADELTQVIPEQPSTAAVDAKVLSASIAMTSLDTKRVADFYKALGIDIRIAQVQPWTPLRQSLTGTGHVDLRSSPAVIPGAKNRWTVFEYPGAGGDGKPFHGDLQDPGVSMFSVRVHDAVGAVKAVKEAGGSVVSTGGETVKTAKGTRVIVRDPEGFFLELMQEQE